MNVVLRRQIWTSASDPPSLNPVLHILTANTMIVHLPICSDWRSCVSDQGQGGPNPKPAPMPILQPTPRQGLTTNCRKNACGCWAASTRWSGLYVASQDLDIVGPGNLLAKEQSGRARCGFELYQSCWKDAPIAKIKSGEMEGVIDDDGQWAPQHQSRRTGAESPRTMWTRSAMWRLGLYRRLFWLANPQSRALKAFAARADRPLWQGSHAEVEHADAGDPDQGDVQTCGNCQSSTGPQGCHDPSSITHKFASPEGLVSFHS